MLTAHAVLAHDVRVSADLPIPLSFVLIGAAWVVASTFAVVAFAWKQPRFDPAHGDWFWQDVSAASTVNTQGILPACSDCHEGRPDNTCIGFGNTNGMDYLCTAP